MTAQSSSGIARWIPAVRTVRRYRRPWLRRDLVAGIVLTAVLVPAGMGYAEAAGLPPISGLYATIVPLSVYAVVGPSRILVLGPDSSLIPLIAAAILPLAAGDEAEAVALAGLLAVFSGLFCLLAGLARFGFLTDLLSKPVRYGYMNGIALTVLVSQLPKLFGFSTDAEGLIPEARAFVRGLTDGQTNMAALAVGVGSLLVIFGCKRWRPTVPGVLVAVVGATVVVGVLGLAERYDLAVVGPLPRGLPSLQIPQVSASEAGALVAGAVGIALVSFADTSVLSRTFAIRGGYRVDPNQELLALGAANVATGLFQGFSVSSSASRTPVAESAGAKTQLTGLVGAMAVALLLLLFPNLLRNLPDSALAAVVIFAAIGLIEITRVRMLYRLRRTEFALSVVCFLGVAVLGVIQGDLHCYRPGAGRLHQAGVASARRRSWPRRRPEGLPRRGPPSRGQAHPRTGDLPLGCTAVLCQRRDIRRPCPAGHRLLAHPCAMGGRGRRAGDGPGHHRCRRPEAAGRGARR